MESQYEKMFGEGYIGRPPAEEHPTGRPTGNRAVTEAARRRATRVLKVKHQREFEKLMDEEITFLMAQDRANGVLEGQGSI